MKNSKKSLRLEGWDYRIPWFYFVTTCTKDRLHYFGEIRDGTMGLSEQGCAAWYFWNEIPNNFDNVKLDAFVVMPNHVHGIIQILPKEKGKFSLGKSHGISPLNKREFGQPKPGSLSVILNQYKGAVKRWCNQKKI